MATGQLGLPGAPACAVPPCALPACTEVLQGGDPPGDDEVVRVFSRCR